MTAPLIMVAPTGARRGKADHPALPLRLPEIVATAAACHAAGAGALHLHLRDRDGAHSLDAGAYREALAELARALPDLAVQITTEAAGRFAPADQLACLEALRPAWASVAVREIARDPALAPRLYRGAAEAGTRIQHILFDPADAALLARWIADGIVPAHPVEAILVVGSYDGRTATDPQSLAGRVAGLPAGCRWMACGFGPAEHAVLAEAARLGGDCRVGFENSLTAPDGRRWRDNAHSVAALVRTLARKEAS